ncbi:MAG: ATP-binding protein [Planctomycetia bacterium]
MRTDGRWCPRVGCNALVKHGRRVFQWAEALGNKQLTGAALDRLTHRCHILEAKGESFRLRDARRRQRRASGPS